MMYRPESMSLVVPSENREHFEGKNKTTTTKNLKQVRIQENIRQNDKFFHKCYQFDSFHAYKGKTIIICFL